MGQHLASWQHEGGGMMCCLVLWEPGRPGKGGVKICDPCREQWRTLRPFPDAMNMSGRLCLHWGHTGGFGVDGTRGQKRCSTWARAECPGGDREAEVYLTHVQAQRTSPFPRAILNCLLADSKTVQKYYMTYFVETQ